MLAQVVVVQLLKLELEVLEQLLLLRLLTVVLHMVLVRHSQLVVELTV